MKRVYIQTFGCQMNAYDTGKVHALLGKDGYEPTESMDDADLIIVTIGGNDMLRYVSALGIPNDIPAAVEGARKRRLSELGAARLGAGASQARVPRPIGKAGRRRESQRRPVRNRRRPSSRRSVRCQAGRPRIPARRQPR